ncbi:MAG TPA: hypothetical protein VH371_13405 [Candidatus Limnocylindrales bacterium]|jgi:hypothetical protein
MGISNLQEVADEALTQTGSVSAAIFVIGPSGRLDLAAAAGVTGAPLDALITAVQAPGHPIARTAQDGKSAFDVSPIAPGGPALRSHIAIGRGAAQDRTLGVLALAHQEPLSEAERTSAEELAAKAAALL